MHRFSKIHYGWIVVGSYNSRNGPMEVSLEAARQIWADTHARFSIDDRSDTRPRSFLT